VRVASSTRCDLVVGADAEGSFYPRRAAARCDPPHGHSRRFSPPTTAAQALNIQTGGMVAIKQVTLRGVSKEQLHLLQQEINLLKLLTNPYIVEYIESFNTKVRAARSGFNLFEPLSRTG